MSTVRVLCAGILVADIFVPPLERLPGEGELVATDDFLIQPGGCAANVAVALGRLGVPAGVCGRIGEDAFGGLIECELAAQGISTRLVRRTPGYATSKTVILPVIGEDRRFVHTFGANAAFAAADLEPALLDAADVLYVGGYLLLPALLGRELARGLHAAHSGGATVVLDVAAPAGWPPSLDSLSTLLPVADYFVPNHDEARMLTGEVDPERQARRLIDYGARRVLIKLGERGVYVRTRNEAFEFTAPSVSVIEPSGAGDAFAAGLIVGILEGWELERMVQFASVIGASACTALGCSAGLFTRAEAEEFLAASRAR